jgi:hypothetical protein
MADNSNVNVPVEGNNNDKDSKEKDFNEDSPSAKGVVQGDSLEEVDSGAAEVSAIKVNHKVGTLSKLWGVSWDKKNRRWCSQLTVPQLKKRVCKSFKRETDAAEEYDRLVRINHVRKM